MSWCILRSNALHIPLQDNSVQCCVTSPPYWGLRDYGVEGQLGLERTPEEYVDNMVAAFREVWRVLRDDGTVWLNLGDSYANDGKWGGTTGGKHVSALHGEPVGRMKRSTGLKPKDLVGIPWRVAFALQADGWYLRSDIIWAKPNPMPESVTDRPTKAHEYIFLLTKSERYFWDQEAVREKGSGKCPGNKTYKYNGLPGHETKQGILKQSAIPQVSRNLRSVWTIATQPYKEAHFATFPAALAERCIKAGSKVGDIILDPFAGAGTTTLVADRLNRHAIGLELKPEYCTLAYRRCFNDAPLFAAL